MPRKEYYWKHRERCKEAGREGYKNLSEEKKEELKKKVKIYQRQHRLCSNGMVFGVDKRLRTDDVCEICGRTEVKKLDYHHWDNSNLNKGIWVCSPCHKMCEGIEKGLDRIYLGFKIQLDNAFKEEDDAH